MINGVLARQLESLVDELNETTRREIRRTALWMRGGIDRAATEDLVQKVWELALEKLSYFDSVPRLKAWFKETAANLTRSYFRLSRRDPQSLDEIADQDDGGRGVLRIEGDLISRDLLLKALVGLSPANQEILRWHYCDGLSLRECLIPRRMRR
jgi:RNA polymerase sigma factor (sigma-70 family)